MPDTNNSPLHDILLSAKKQGAIDIHFVVGTPPMMHIKEEFLPMANVDVTTSEFTTALMQSLVAPEDQVTFAQTKELVRTFAFPDGLRVRYQIGFQKGVPSLSFHLLSDTVPVLAGLRLPNEVVRFASLTRGLVLIVGPYASGRSSTAAALLQDINQKRSSSIVTIESPIEYVLAAERSLVEQRQVGRDVPSYTAALQALTKSDAEVIMLDSMQEVSAIPLVFELAMTRVVLAVVEAADSLHAIERIIASVPPREEAATRAAFSDALVGAIAQRAVTSKAGSRIIIAEVVLGNNSVKAVVRDGKLSQLMNIIQTSRQEGMVSLDQALAEALRAGDIEEDEAMRHAVDQNYLKGLLERKAR